MSNGGGALPARRLPVVGVMGSGGDEHDDLAAPLGRWLARRGVHLLTGGGRGVMEAVSRAFHGVEGRRGLVIGVLPASDDGPFPPDGYPNPWIEIAVRTHLPARGDAGDSLRSRNAINVLSADVVVALPGGSGTASEIRLAVRYGRPVVAYRPEGRGEPVPDSSVPVATTLAEVQSFVNGAVAG